MNGARCLMLLVLAAGSCARAPASTPGEAPPKPSATQATAPPTSASSAPGVASAPATKAPSPDLGPPPVIHGGGAKSAKSDHGMVVSVEAEATRAGVRVLEAGGNAVDAAVTVALVLAVTHPSAGNIGGGGFMLVRPKGGPTRAIDFRETAPRRCPRDEFDAMVAADGIGAVSVGVPGHGARARPRSREVRQAPFRATRSPPPSSWPATDTASARAKLRPFAWNWNALEQDTRRLAPNSVTGESPTKKTIC